MAQQTHEQISQWLKKLERESWQLELLVSAFTIFLLIQAIGAFDGLMEHYAYTYNFDDSILTFVYIFFALVSLCIRALAMFLILHLLLRGFWIGAIGLRSVQSSIDFDKLNYSEFFTEKLKKRVTSLDNLVVMLDEVCSLMFSFAFLVISVLIAFGLWLFFFGLVAIGLSSLPEFEITWLEKLKVIVNVVIVITLTLSGFIYFIDYFTLGFFKKYKLISKIYYPFYRLYGIITISVISKSIYYYLISKFSKRRIRIVYFVIGFLVMAYISTHFDQYIYFPQNFGKLAVVSDRYDNLRPDEEHVEDVSIQSHVIDPGFLQLFLRYNPQNNQAISRNCPDFEPIKEDGLNWSLQIVTPEGGGFQITDRDYTAEDKPKILDCLSSYYQVSINDSLYAELDYYFFRHPAHKQKGLLSMISTEGFRNGENILSVKTVTKNSKDSTIVNDLAQVRFWYTGLNMR